MKLGNIGVIAIVIIVALAGCSGISSHEMTIPDTTHTEDGFESPSETSTETTRRGTMAIRNDRSVELPITVYYLSDGDDGLLITFENGTTTRKSRSWLSNNSYNISPYGPITDVKPTDSIASDSTVLPPSEDLLRPLPPGGANVSLLIEAADPSVNSSRTAFAAVIECDGPFELRSVELEMNSSGTRIGHRCSRKGFEN